jgi:L-alanine-DL-glutamate epimerase-like enolase superfamily enzyme
MQRPKNFFIANTRFFVFWQKEIVILQLIQTVNHFFINRCFSLRYFFTTMLQITTHKFDLRLRHTFKISRESRDVQPTLIVELSDGQFSGLGEATLNKYYGITYENLEAALQSIQPLLDNYHFSTPEKLWDDVAPALGNNPFALCALDEAAHDLNGQRLGQPLYAVWGLDPKKAPLTNYTIGIADVDTMVKKMLDFPWPLYKIKLGTDHDMDIMRNLRQHSGAKFRVDANCAWTAEQTVEYAQELKTLGVEFIEQPLKADNWEGMKQVFEKSVLPVVADESCIAEADVDRCAGYFHGVNIKLMKCGGLTPARRMVARARQLGMKVMVGCMTESTVGISAIAHLSPLLDYVDMDGQLLIANDPAIGVEISATEVRFAPRNGIGVQLLHQQA